MSDRDDIVEALGRYARALENRGGKALAALCIADAQFLVFSRYGQEDYEALDADPVSLATICGMLDNSAMPAGRGMHYLTTDHIVDITGDQAWMQAQFLVVGSTANARPETGWPSDANMMQGTLTLAMIGYYQSQLRKVDGRWLFARHEVKHSLPMVRPSR
jgi:hypothetical protein